MPEHYSLRAEDGSVIHDRTDDRALIDHLAADRTGRGEIVERVTWLIQPNAEPIVTLAVVLRPPRNA